MMLTKEKRDYLRSVYFDPSRPASFGGIGKIWNNIKADGIVTRKELKDWLLEQDTYTSSRPYVRKFKRPRTVVPYVDAVWGSDVAYMLRYERHNDGYGYFVVFIDIFSRYAWAYPLKTLRGAEMVKVMENQFKDEKCEKLFTDGGSEYNNRLVKSFLKREGVYHYTSTNEKKVAHAERLIKQLKKKLIMYMDENETFKWIDVLDDFVNSYNNTYHRSIKMTPSQARQAEQYEVWRNQYVIESKPKKIGKPKNKIAHRFNQGDKVKLLAEKKPFDREYDQLYTTEYFTITDRYVKDGVPMYKIKDELNDPIIGSFYEKELTKVIVPDDKAYKIEKVLRRRKRNGKQEYFVKFVGWPKKFNSWVDDISDI